MLFLNFLLKMKGRMNFPIKMKMNDHLSGSEDKTWWVFQLEMKGMRLVI